MYELIRRLTLKQLTLEQLPQLFVALVIAELFYKFHSFLLETSAFLLTWFALGALYEAVKPLVIPTKSTKEATYEN